MSLAQTRLSAELPWRPLLGPRHAAATIALGLTGVILASFAWSITSWTLAAWVALPLVALAALWISGGAATAVLGLFTLPAPPATIPPQWRPSSRTAILVTLCKEDPRPLARHLTALRAGLNRAGLQDAAQIFVLSDTSGADLATIEEAAMAPLARSGVLTYRRRKVNTGRKPGNIADWLQTHGERFDHMLVLDADSRMRPERIRRMIWQMDTTPRLGLLQAGIALLPARSRFGRHQRLSARQLGRGFGRGFAAWSGESGNYWGHNAIMRVAAFRAASDLPVLPGSAPLGGALLSHDFVEAAWIRRAGWSIALDPATDGSAEAAPETMADFHARDRRWCQGNLQHLAVIAAPGLHPISRLHLAMGILSYLVAPIWLTLVVLMACGQVPLEGSVPLILVALVLLLPKLCALAERWHSARTKQRRWVLLRASLAELAVSSIIAPLLMLRQAGAVMAVCLGRDCGWKTVVTPRPGRPSKHIVSLTERMPSRFGEALAGWALVALAISTSGPAAAWLAPVALPLCFAPLATRLLDAPA